MGSAEKLQLRRHNKFFTSFWYQIKMILESNSDFEHLDIFDELNKDAEAFKNSIQFELNEFDKTIHLGQDQLLNTLKDYDDEENDDKMMYMPVNPKNNLPLLFED